MVKLPMAVQSSRPSSVVTSLRSTARRRLRRSSVVRQTISPSVAVAT